MCKGGLDCQDLPGALELSWALGVCLRAIPISPRSKEAPAAVASQHRSKKLRVSETRCKQYVVSFHVARSCQELMGT